MKERYEKIKKEYEKLHKSFLAKGRLPLKSTDVGFWSIAVSDDCMELFKRIRLSNFKNFLDLGSGDGKVSMIAALFTTASGIEYDEELHNIAVKLKHKLKSDALFFKEDYMKHDLSDYDIIFINPDKKMHAIEDKLKREFKGTLIVYGSEYLPESLEEKDSFTALTTPVKVYKF